MANGGLIKSRILNTNPNGRTVGRSVTKDMKILSPAAILPVSSFPFALSPTGGNVESNYSNPRAWNDWGDDIFDTWGYFYIFSVQHRKYAYIPFDTNKANGPDAISNELIMDIPSWGKTFKITYGYAVQGVFRVIIEETSEDSSFKFIFGVQGNMGSDGSTSNTLGSFQLFANPVLNVQLNRNQQSGNNTEVFYTYFAPYVLESFNEPYVRTISSDLLGMYSTQVSLGITMYFSKTNDVNAWLKDDLVVTELNKMPTTPSAFLTQPKLNQNSLSHEKISLSWFASTDADNDAITYELSISDGTDRTTIKTGITETKYEMTLPKMTSNTVKIGVKAIDARGGESAILESNVFSVSEQRILIKDGEIIKTFTDKVWRTL